MKKILFVLLAVLLNVMLAQAQDALFGAEKSIQRKGVIFGVNGSLDLPAADMAKRFGTGYRIGGSVGYKTTSNWMFGVKMDFILGNKIMEDSFMHNIADEEGFLFSQDGERLGVGTFERGYMVGVQGGKIFTISKKNSNSGILVMTTVGFMQHKINIFDIDKSIPQLRGDFRKGYDRLTNGAFLEQYVGYNHFSNNALINFHIGLDVVAGFTKGRRDYLYDVMRTDNQQRLDVLFGIRGGWYIPIFKRKSEEIFFD